MGCVYSPLGLVIFVAVKGTFVRFTKGHDHFCKTKHGLIPRTYIIGPIMSLYTKDDEHFSAHCHRGVLIRIVLMIPELVEGVDMRRL